MCRTSVQSPNYTTLIIYKFLCQEFTILLALKVPHEPSLLLYYTYNNVPINVMPLSQALHGENTSTTETWLIGGQLTHN